MKRMLCLCINKLFIGLTLFMILLPVRSFAELRPRVRNILENEAKFLLGTIPGLLSRVIKTGRSGTIFPRL